MPSHKLLCTECDWRGLDEERLTAENPFDRPNIIHGCPKCKEVECFRFACDEPGCWRPIECGMPTANGYRNTCHEHNPSPS